MLKSLVSFFCSLVFISLHGFTQHTAKPDLTKAGNFQAVNRTITLTSGNNQSPAIHLDAKPGSGVAWINNLDFTGGTIELDIKGRNLPQQSFVGLAFYGVNDSTYEAVYFRPFNFQSPDTARKNHSVQYISLPRYDWPVLRDKFPNKYERALYSVVDPDSWFHVRMVVHGDVIEAFVNTDNEPSLTVKRLTYTTSGKIGFWVGNNAEGYFSNLVINRE